MAHPVRSLACLLMLAVAAARDQSRWSRQISSYTSDIGDWVPLPGPVERDLPAPPAQKRQSVAEPRILTEPFTGFSRPTGFSQEAFPPRAYFNAPANRQLYLQSVPSAPQNFLTDQGFGQSHIRFGLGQPNYPLNQGFVSPQMTFDAVPQLKPRPLPSPPSLLQANAVKFVDNNPKALPTQQTKSFVNQGLKVAPKQQSIKFVDGYRLENDNKKKAQSLQKLKYESFDKLPKPDTSSFTKPKSEREEVQLLYVPLESLNRGSFNFRSPLLNTDFQNTKPGTSIPVMKQSFGTDYMLPGTKTFDDFNSGQSYFTEYNTNVDQVPKFSSISSPFPTLPPTTPKPKKLKPHQPPLAIFLTQDSRRGQVRVGDVLTSLKNAETIAVLDSVHPETAPKVFIGPSSLKAPETFVKFELPYLSNIENSDRKIKQLPFFVAPLSYNTPQGFAKIPFPSPHVGSVVINSQIKETQSQPISSTPRADIIPNSYSVSPPSYRQEQQTQVTQKPTFSYYSTSSPRTNSPVTKPQQSNYYSFEPQTVSSISSSKERDSILTAPPKSSNFYSTNANEQYNPQAQFVSFPENKYSQETAKPYRLETTTAAKTTSPTTTTKLPSTYPSQLLETHNPYSINQAFHFSTPLDYQNAYEEGYATPGHNTATPTPTPAISSTITNPPRTRDYVTENTKSHQPSSPTYLQNYSPEIHYQSEIQNTRFPVYNSNDYTTKAGLPVDNNQPINSNGYSNVPVADLNPTPEYNGNIESQPPPIFENVETVDNGLSTTSDASLSTRSPYYNQYETNFDSAEASKESTSSTTTTTTRRTPLRNRARPRYTTPRSESHESTTRTVVTRRPLRERRPLPPRPKYEPNRITTEKPVRKLSDSSESTTKSSRNRVRGRVQFKSSVDADEVYTKRNKGPGSEDLAYQRDVLHQNYPVTLQERSSTVDIEAITEPIPKSSPTDYASPTEAYDSANAYSYDKATISEHSNSREIYPSYSPDIVTEGPYVPKLPSTRHDEYSHLPKTSATPLQDSFALFDVEKEQATTPSSKSDRSEFVTYTSESPSPVTEQSVPSFSVTNEFSVSKEESEVSVPELEITKSVSKEVTQEVELETVVQTTPSYNRVRVRPGQVRQYHQASSTESPRVKSERRKPVQAFTYRPAFERRRTTMRIEEIEADLKTKPVHARSDQEFRHPVYKPDPTTEPAITTPTSGDVTKRGSLRRRRPGYSYTTTTTEPGTSTKKPTFENKYRPRGRRPTEKPTSKPEIQTETAATTAKTVLHSRYIRPRLSERYTKRPDPEETEDQDSNYSINRPKYVEPDNDQWSPKISSDSFKPYNPNDIVLDNSKATTERRSDRIEANEMDIITARSDYDDILIPVTPVTNKLGKKLPEIPPTLEALVEQTKIKKSDTNDAMSNFESMLEEVMKSLEEQDEDEYSSNVMKHKGGEIGEIPPERIISFGDTTKAPQQEEELTTPTSSLADEESTHQEVGEKEKEQKAHRRGYWKKVRVRPITAESIDVAESQYYPQTVNRLGQTVTLSKTLHNKLNNEKTKVTTYKPSNIQFVKDILNSEETFDDVLNSEILKGPEREIKDEIGDKVETLKKEIQTEKPTSPGDFDLGTGTPDPGLIDNMYYSTPTEPTASESVMSMLEKSDEFSLMDYLFGVNPEKKQNDNAANKTEALTTKSVVEITTVQDKSKITTESTYIPEEITSIPDTENDDSLIEYLDIKKLGSTEKPEHKRETAQTTEKSETVESTSVSSYMDSTNVVSTSMSTEVSHETEICFRGKCIKTSRDLL